MIDIDFETRSKADIMECGAWRYSEDASTEILCMQWSHNGEEPQNWIPGMPYPKWAVDTNEFIRLGGQIRAHNVAFEQAIWMNICIPSFKWIMIDHRQWIDTMAQAAAMSLPMSLEDCGSALSLPVVKDTEGKRVMQQLSRPRRPSKDNPKEWMEKEDYPEKFDILYKYCSTDVKAQTAIGNFLPQLITKERWVACLDRIINTRGVGIDIDLAHKALEIIDTVEKEGIARIKEITGGVVETASQVAKLLQWARSQGVELTSLTKDSVANTLKDEKLPENVREVLYIRQLLGKSSTKKIVKMIEAASIRDHRVRNTLLYHGSSTGRWAGRLIQVQNFPRGLPDLDVDQAIEDILTLNIDQILIKYPNITDVISSCLRGFIVPKKGNKFYSADFNAIEPRVLFYLAEQEDAVDIYRNNGDIYKEMASVLFNVKVEEVNKQQRQLGKIVILGCGYGLGATKFIMTCAQQGVTIDEETAVKAVKAYRSRFNRIPEMWKEVENAAMEAVAFGEDTFAAKCRFHYNKTIDFLQIFLPSGRPISYHRPRISQKEREVFDSKTKKKKMIKVNELTFMGSNSMTKQYVRMSTYGGSLVENIVQAVARDCLVEGLFRLEKAKYFTIMTVHDEVVSEVKEDFGSIKEYEELLNISPSWAPDLPIKSEAWEGKRYRK